MKLFKIIMFLFILSVIYTPNCYCSISKDKAYSKFIEANYFYRDEKYEDAIKSYEEIISGGMESGAAYYNLGNSYFKAGHLGEAILNYERAEKLIPRDSDLNYNFAYLKSLVNDLGVSNQKNLFINKIKTFVQFFTKDELVFIITLVVFCIATVFLLGLYLRWSNKLRNITMSPFILFLLIFIFCFSFRNYINKDDAIIISETSSKFEPKEDSTTHFKLHEGTKIQVIKSKGDWIKIKREDGKLGWVLSETLELI